MKRIKSDLLFQNANRVIPTGIYGHMAPGAGLPLDFPHFCSSGKGARFTDVDGNEWMDFMCGFGAVLHGYRHEAIEQAVQKQRELGSVFNQPHFLMVELAEKLVELIDFADWAVFAKNGSDLTTWAIRVAREKTGKEYIIKVKGAYHGVDAWCDPGMGGRISSDREFVLEFEWNNLQQLESLLVNHSNQVAAVILTPYHHASFGPSELPSVGFWKNVEMLCKQHDAALVLDDVRCGWRLDDSGSHNYFGFCPDLAIYSKALGNGYAISACVGKDKFRTSAADVFLTGSCWNDAYAFSAALASLQISRENLVAKSVLEKGKYFCSKLEEIGQEYGIKLKMTGVPSMPYPWIEGDEDLYQIQGLCKFAAAEGLYFHPHHNWFISNALSYEDLDQALFIAKKALGKFVEQ